MSLHRLFTIALAISQHVSSMQLLSFQPGRDIYTGREDRPPPLDYDKQVPEVTTTKSRTTGQQITKTEVYLLIDSIQQLGISLSLQDSLTNKGNVVLSPLSIGSLLSVILLGARRDTHAELKNAMNLKDLTDSQIHHSYQKVLGSLESLNRDVLLEVASKLYIQIGYSLGATYLQIAEAFYNVTIGGVDFVSGGSKVREEINQWVSDRTHHKITDFVTRDFTRDTRFVAVNAVYFNGNWETPFNPLLTEPNGLFRTGIGRDIRIPMMKNILSSKHFSDNLGFDMIALPYEGNQFSMYIILPQGGPSPNELTQIERSLTPDRLNDLIKSMKVKKVAAQIPKMKISSKMSLKNSLKRLNVNALFNSSKVDLGRLSSTPGLFVEDIQHEAIIEVTEIGTEAAAATGITADRILGYTDFIMDKPAILFIRDDVNGVILFWAKVIEPSPV